MNNLTLAPFLTRVDGFFDGLFSPTLCDKLTWGQVEVLKRTAVEIGTRAPSAVSPNVLNCQFDTPASNRKWMVDFTYLWTAEGWHYVGAVVDLFSRRVVAGP